jgi:hypothetical protein
MRVTAALNTTSSRLLACASLMAARVRSAGQSQPQGIAHTIRIAGQADHLLNLRCREWVHQLGGKGP